VLRDTEEFSMTEREKVLSQVDNLKEALEKIVDERDKLASESEDLRSSRREAEEKTWAAEEKVKELETELEKAKADAEKYKTKAKESGDELKELKSQMSELESSKDSAVDELRRERDELKKEMDEINEQLGRVSELYREASAEKEALQEKVDVSDLLAIYITLIETVFYGKPHARILYTLHDVKSAITRSNIASSTGIQPAVVLKAVHDLQNADLVSYDEDSQEVNLTKDILRRAG
jgi:uncharacterized coiled-coil DUF342 family protein